jgi:hypothetical protein
MKVSNKTMEQFEQMGIVLDLIKYVPIGVFSFGLTMLLLDVVLMVLTCRKNNVINHF